MYYTIYFTAIYLNLLDDSKKPNLSECYNN